MYGQDTVNWVLDDVNELADCWGLHQLLCVDTVVSCRSVKVYPKKKLLVTKHMKHTKNELQKI